MEEKENSYHVPVMLDESVKGLNIQEGGIYVDVTSEEEDIRVKS